MTEQPSDPASKTFGGDFRRFFLRGLSVIIPPMLTIAILLWAFNFIDANIGQYVTAVVRQIMASGNTRPTWVTEEDALKYGEPLHEIDNWGRQITWEYKQLVSPVVADKTKVDVLWRVFFRKYHLNVIGFVLGILLIYFLGYVLASFIGRGIWRMIERAMFRIPLVRAVYPHVKQVSDLLLAEKKMDVSAVVAVEYPRPGIWALGLVVGSGPPFREVQDRLSSDGLTVFIMSSPTPFTGLPVWVRREEVVQLPMTLDEAVRFCVSCGVVAPGGTEVLRLKAQSPWQPTRASGPAKSDEGQQPSE